ncbi:MAG: thiamine-phosphate kinase [Cellvibrionaceae bacterium]
MSEFELIATYFKRQTKQLSLVKGIGDDCAIVAVDSNRHLVMSMDTLIVGRHFPDNARPSQIATRSFCTCLSDLAAMGATPQWFTLALTLPEADREWVSEFSDALFAIADEFECDLIGGDTTQGPLTITLQVHGFVEKDKALTRDAAQVDDLVLASGPLGDGKAALEFILNKDAFPMLDELESAYLLERFYRPEPQIEIGRQLLNCANAGIDISDGLLADVQHIADASKVDVEIDLDEIPLSDACLSIAGSGRQAINYALSGGDDYQLVCTVSPHNISMIEHLLKGSRPLSGASATLSVIGRVVVMSSSRPTVRCFEKGHLISMKNQTGYQHFAS